MPGPLWPRVENTVFTVTSVLRNRPEKANLNPGIMTWVARNKQTSHSRAMPITVHSSNLALKLFSMSSFIFPMVKKDKSTMCLVRKTIYKRLEGVCNTIIMKNYMAMFNEMIDSWKWCFMKEGRYEKKKSLIKLSSHLLVKHQLRLSICSGLFRVYMFSIQNFLKYMK